MSDADAPSPQVVAATAQDEADVAGPIRSFRQSPRSPAAASERFGEPHGGSILRLLPPPRGSGEMLSGKVEFETLTIDPAVTSVEFFLDGERVGRRTVLPFKAKIDLADPPREQVVRAEAFGGGGRPLGHDEMVVNRYDPPFRVRVASIERKDGEVKVVAEVSVPRKAELEKVAFFLTDEPIGELRERPFVATLASADVGPEDYVRVTAVLADGRHLEDVELLQPGVFAEEVDVRLVQLQVLVTDKAGAPVTGLAAEDFEIVDGAEKRKVERLYLSRNVALVLGLAIDSSGSMGPIWPQTQVAIQGFLEHTLGARDRAFLVDFDSRLRLLQPVTGDKQALYWAMGRLHPAGGTALYDSILYSLLQYDGEPGRRALIVVTDGVDSESKADPRRTIEFGERLGVPVYIIAMSSRGAGGGRPGAGSMQAMARSELMLITKPTGGRMFHVVTNDQVAAAFERIREELSKQYVLTYYTDSTPDPRSRPVVKIKQKGLRVRIAIPLDLAG